MEEYGKIAIRIIVFRLVIAITFLASSIGLQVALSEEVLLTPYFYFAALVLVLEIAYLLIFAIFEKFKNNELFIYLQLIGDSLTVIVLLFYTGGESSVFLFLPYFLIIVAGSILRRRGAILVALINGFLYGLLSLSLYYGWVRPSKFFKIVYEPPSAAETFNSLITNLIGFLLVAVLVSAMAERVEKSRKELGKTQKDLRFFRNLNDLIVSSMAGGIVTTDLNGKVIFSTPKAREFLLIPVSEGWNLFEQIEERGGPNLSPEKIGDFPYELCLNLPYEKYLSLTISPLKEEGKTIGFLTLLKDETEIVKMREEVELKQRLILLGEMAANMAHEIKNPLGSISGAAQMLKMSKPFVQEERELLSIIHKESLRLAEVLDNFLRFVNPGCPEKVDTDIVSLTKEIIVLYEKNPFCVEKNLKISLKSEKEKILIKIDANLYKQALWNLLQNARKASKEYDEITISLRNDEQFVIVEVADRGIGMAKVELTRINQPFKTGFQQGVGLGLSVVRKIVELHNGKMEIDSKYKEGTTVSLYFKKE